MFGERIKRARIAEGLSLRELSKKVDLSATMLSKYERNLIAPSSDLLLKIADALNMQKNNISEVVNNLVTQVRLGEASMAQQYKYLTDATVDYTYSVEDGAFASVTEYYDYGKTVIDSELIEAHGFSKFIEE